MEYGIGNKPLLLRVATMYNSHYQDTMVAIKLYGHRDKGAIIKLGEQYFADQFVEPQSRGISLLCASVVHKWMLHDYDFELEISGYTGKFNNRLVLQLISVTTIKVSQAMYNKQTAKLEQLGIDRGGELKEGILPLIESAMVELGY
ncbi:hypothetical protein [Photobacterium lutimaris]|nr:hypothetical protein [Photobacterium lutimaris]